MIVTPIHTQVITSRSVDLVDLLVESLPGLKEGSIVAITSKIVSLCEGRTVPVKNTDKAALIKQESELYTDPLGQYGFVFTVADGTLIPGAGIDESNAGDNYILWPADAQATANYIWQALRRKYNVQHLGIVITDSTCKPLRRGVVGIAMAHCGFAAFKNYVGTPDLFGRPFTVSQSSIAEGLAATAVLCMGEGTERTPVCLIEDVLFVEFVHQPPTDQELKDFYIPIDEDLFAPMIQAVAWHTGGRPARDDR